MPNTYSQISIHAVFAVKHRDNIITKGWRDELHKYISGIITNEDCTSLAVGGWQDHVHVFFGVPPTVRISDFMRIVKVNSSKWINERRFVRGKFQWQDGYGAFSHSRSQRDKVIQYVINQELHHKTQTFRNEYLSLLDNSGVKFDEKYVFEFYD